jgi:uncharacterized protein with HEPN domain
MTQHNDMIRLQHMLDHAKEAVALIAGKGRAELQHNRVLELALIRLVEIVGEASVKVSSETQAKYPSIPWPQVIGMRNRLIHGYDSVDLDVLWDTIEIDLPPLIAELEKILGETGEE